MISIFGNLLGHSTNLLGACGSITRILQEAAAISAHVQGQNAVRWFGVALSAVGLVAVLLCAADRLTGGGNLAPQLQGSGRLVVVVFVLVGQAALFAGIIAGLLAPSSRDWFER
jgi:hypothetical protein